MGRRRLYSVGAAAVLIVLAPFVYQWVDHWGEPPSVQTAELDLPPEKMAPANIVYEGAVEVDPEHHRVVGQLEVQVRNVTGKAQDAVYFHVYPEQFRHDDQLTGENWTFLLGDKREPGFIDVGSVSVNGRLVNPEQHGTVLKVPNPDWQPDGVARVELDFTMQLPKNNSRLSYDDHAVWLGNALPIVAAYDHAQPKLDPYYPMGDPFYSDIGYYKLRVTTPKNWQLAASGVQKEVDAHNGKSTYEVTANAVRDLALVAMDNTYRVKQSNTMGVLINTWYRPSAQEAATENIHQAAIKGIRWYSDHFGRYPYGEYDVVATGGFFGGMEYPGIVFVQDRYFNDTRAGGERVVIHETGHQWWYGMVGSNEVAEPWVDEALTDYSTLRVLQDEYPSLAQGMLKRNEQQLDEKHDGVTANVGSSVDQFANWKDYSSLVYGKGSMMFYFLQSEVGQEKIDQALQTYWQRYLFKNATGQDLVNVFAEVLGPNVKPYFETWLHGDTATFKK